MNKKGFTLIELIVSIAILAMLSTIIIKCVSHGLNKAKNEALCTMIESIELSAEHYATNNEGILTNYATNDWVKIPIETLIKNDYFSNSLTNPKTKKDIPMSDIVYVRRNEKGKIESTYDINQNEKAILTLNGAYNVYVKKGGTYTEKGVIATTKEGLNVTNQVVKTGTMDTNTLGTYVITYTYDNVSITRNVIVVTSEMITERIWHALTINPNGGTYNGSVSNKIYSLKEGSNQTIANPTRTNYNFTGWSRTCTSCLSGGIYTMGTAEDTLTANWVLSAYTLTVNANGGTWSGTTPQTIVKGSTVTINNPTKSGTIFLGWMVNGTGSSMSGTTFTMGTANTTITAIWLAYTYTGSSTIIDDGSGNWRIKFLTSGTFTPSTNMVIEAFLVGGGGGGGGGYAGGNNYAGAGGGGGYTNTQGVASLTANTSYVITVGAGGAGGGAGGSGSSGGTTSAFNYTAGGGTGGSMGGSGGTGGSGGGAAYFQLGGVNGGTNGGQGLTNSTSLGGTGQGYNTYEFGNSSLTLYSGGGGAGGAVKKAGGYGGSGGGANGGGGAIGIPGSSASANTGGGGGGAAANNGIGGTGGSGIVVIRNSYTSYVVGNTTKYSFTYTGRLTITNQSLDTWKIKFLSGGTFTPTSNMTIKLFLVGGGGGGGAGYVNGNNYAGSGGGGGYTSYYTSVSLTANTGYTIVIGTGGTGGTNGGTGSTGGTTSAFSRTASGGIGGNCGGAGGAGGSGGGAAYFQATGKNGGTNGGNGTANSSNAGGVGQGTTTYEFNNSSLTLYSGGGGSGGAVKLAGGYGGSGGGANGGGGAIGISGSSAEANTGGGGGGATSYNATGGNGGSGVVVIALP